MYTACKPHRERTAHPHANLRDVTAEQRELVDKAVDDLETDGGVPDAASSPLVDGTWRLIFTTTPGTASPVQRSFVGVDNFAIYQDIDLFSEVTRYAIDRDDYCKADRASCSTVQ